VCKGCKSGCREKDVVGQKLTVECPTCGGVGCGACNNGQFDLNQCPQEFCREVVPALGLIDRFNDGQAPVDGGVLDQSAWFVDAANFIKREDAIIKSEIQHGK